MGWRKYVDDEINLIRKSILYNELTLMFDSVGLMYHSCIGFSCACFRGFDVPL